MARSRNIKPAFFKNDLLGECDMMTRLLFVGLWTLADCNGKVEDRPKRIAAEIFPYDNNPEMERALRSLFDLGFIDRYHADDKRVIQIVNFKEHQNPHQNEKPSGLPEKPEGYIYQQLEDESINTQDSSGNGAISTVPILPIKDSLTPITDPLIPDSPSTDSLRVTATAKQSPPPKKSGDAKSKAIWESYRRAYERRYQVDPVRNAKTNKQLCMVVDRLGADDAPLVAEFYVNHNNGFYVSRMHTVDLMLNDCEKLRTEWATNRQMTGTEARQVDQKQNNLSAINTVIAKRKAEGRLS